MNALKFVVALLLALAPLTSVHADEQWRNLTEISCGQIFQCLTVEEVQGFTGKTLKYRNARFQDFGYVYLTLKDGGKLEGRNDKSSASGSWEMKDNVIIFKTNTWSDFTLLFYKIGDQVFATTKTPSGGGSLFPVAVVSN